MSAPGRLLALALGLTVLVALVGCGSDGGGIPDSKIRSALQMKSIQGHLAIEANPFCSTSKLLNDSGEVKKASSTGLVIASRDQSVGVQILKPFAPSCRGFAQRKLDKLASPKKKHKHENGHKKQKKQKQKGGGGGG